jgi:hypothetical protein
VKRLEIFKPGRHTAKDGRSLTFTPEQLAACAAAYDPALHEAPIVIGHPKDNEPAYGWVKSLDFGGSTLNAEPHQVEPQFAEMVQAGRFKKVSASFYLPDAPENPKPGALYLRHIGFLGAQPPAVRGLKAASFADAGQGVVEFTDWTGMTIAGLFRRIKNWIIDQAGQEKADAVIPEYEIENLQVSAAQKDEPAPSYSEHSQGADDVDKQELDRRQAQLKADQEKLERERAEFAEREKRLKAEEAAAARARNLAACGAFVDEQVKEGRVLPAHREGLVAFMASLPSEGTVEFGEGDKAVKKPAAEWLREYLKAQPKVVDFQERARPDGAAAPEGAEAIAKAAVEFKEAERKAGRVVSVSQAVKHVTGGSQ